MNIVFRVAVKCEECGKTFEPRLEKIRPEVPDHLDDDPMLALRQPSFHGCGRRNGFSLVVVTDAAEG